MSKVIPPMSSRAFGRREIIRSSKKSEEIVIGLNFKLIVENMQNCRWQKPSVPPSMIEQRIARCRNLEEGFMEVDNSKQLARIRMRWSPPKESWVKLNFDGTARREGSAVGGMVRDSSGRMLLAYVGNLGKALNNVVEAMALLWGLKLVIGVGWENLMIEGDLRIVVEIVKWNMKDSWAIKRVIEEIWHLLTIMKRYDL